MSLYGMMRTGVSGMNAQANRLSAVADNIANSSTTGYKRSSIEFASLVMPNATGNYTSGGVTTDIRYSISQQGDLRYTSSGSDLAINGEGFFVVQDASGRPALTRAGSFVPDGEGRLVNAAGYYLMGYNFANGVPSPVTNGFGGLEEVKIGQTELTATPSSNGIFKANLAVDATDVAPGNLPSLNLGTAEWTSKSSMVVYDNVGREVVLDIYFTKTADNAWQVDVFDQSLSTPGTSFPYTSGPLETINLTFDPANGQLTSPSVATIPVPGGASLTVDLAGTTELGQGFTVLAATVDGNAPSGIENVQISADGTVYAQYADGSFKALYRVPIATVPSPDRLGVLPGNAFSQSSESGDLRIGFANEGGMGAVVSGALENSNVDIAEELTSMIESQRSYTANSKVFQTGADLMDILVNLKR
ncbi:MAG: flagellar hook protein FlgE [Rhizobiaceae bacterium]